MARIAPRPLTEIFLNYDISYNKLCANSVGGPGFREQNRQFKDKFEGYDNSNALQRAERAKLVHLFKFFIFWCTTGRL
jgi:hypothetical protein